MFEVGKEYTDKGGREWKCVHVEDRYAWLKPVDSNTAAYVWTMNGKSISLNSCYDFENEPEWVKTFDADEEESLSRAFVWDYTPEGHDYWEDQYNELTLSGAKRWLEMREQYKKWRP